MFSISWFLVWHIICAWSDNECIFPSLGHVLFAGNHNSLNGRTSINWQLITTVMLLFEVIYRQWFYILSLKFSYCHNPSQHHLITQSQIFSENISTWQFNSWKFNNLIDPLKATNFQKIPLLFKIKTNDHYLIIYT